MRGSSEVVSYGVRGWRGVMRGSGGVRASGEEECKEG